MPEFLESLIKLKINIIKNGYTSWSLPNGLQDGNYKLMLANITLRYFLTNKRIDIKASVHDVFLESPSSGTFKIKR